MEQDCHHCDSGQQSNDAPQESEEILTPRKSWLGSKFALHEAERVQQKAEEGAQRRGSNLSQANIEINQLDNQADSEHCGQEPDEVAVQGDQAGGEKDRQAKDNERCY